MSPARLDRVENAIRVVLKYHDALVQGDLSSVLDLLNDDCSFESPYPLPSGRRCTGKAEISTHLQEFFQTASGDTITAQEVFNAGTRVILRWKWTRSGEANSDKTIEGVDIFRVSGGLISEKLTYIHA